MSRIVFTKYYLFHMLITIIGFYFRGHDTTACEEVEVLSDLVRRARNYQADGIRGSDPFIDDRYISPGFYSVTNEKGQYLMPDKESMPGLDVCGAQQPIYIKGKHPDITTLTNDSTDVVACEHSPFDVCENERHISIRKCGDDIQYYLQQTSQNSAYCFDPPELQNVIDIDEAPDVVLGEMSVRPKLDFYDFTSPYNGKTYNHPKINFECTEEPFKDRSSLELFYSTYWFIDYELMFSFERKNGSALLTEDDLFKKDEDFKLGKNIRCGIRVSKSATGMQTEMKSSDDFFAGVKVHNKTIYMDKDEVATVLLEQTVPYGCISEKNALHNDSCTIQVQLKLPDSAQCEIADSISGSRTLVNDVYARCGTQLTGFHYHQVLDTLTLPVKTMTVTTQYLSDSDPETYSFALVTQDGGQMDMWKDVDLGVVTIFISNNDKFTEGFCYSHVDPHMKSRDGKRYENNNFAGEFILYKNILYGTEVQEKTVSCWGNNGRPFCTCAVAVRSGGDVFLINLCNKSRYIGMTSCKDKGAILVENENALEYQVQTSIGTLVNIKIRPHPGYYNLMNVDIHMAPKDYKQTVGLCGTYDGNRNNDFHKRDGTTMADKDRIEFINQWKIGPNDVNMLYPSCNLNISTWTEQGNYPFCTCNCFKTQPCKAPNTEVHCGPSQFVNCTTDLDSYIQSDLCMDFERKCSENSLKRSALSADNRHEMERKASLARTESLYMFKRETADENPNITEEYAKNLCTERLGTNPIAVQHSNLLRGFNISHAIEDCTYDLFISQDTGWIEGHQSAISAAVKAGFKRNANYTATHSEELLEFKKQSCPSNCSSRGNCSEKGKCICDSGYFGPDCSKISSEGPEIEDIESSGFCDTRYKSECRCFEVQVDLLAEEYFCKRKYQIQLGDGERQTISTDIVQGSYKNLFTGECCFETGRAKRSYEAKTDIIVYMYDVSISNDGENFGGTTALYIYDSTCLTPVTSVTGNVSFKLQDKSCLINGNCYNEEDFDLNDDCMKCIPTTNQFNWTKVCTVDNTKTAESPTKLIIIVVVSVLVAVSLTVLVCYFICKKSKKTKRMVTPSHSFMSLREKETTSDIDRYRDNHLRRFKSDTPRE